MNFLINFSFFGLFIASFAASTILPIGSEPIFASLVLTGFNPITCLIIASIGNWLGGMTNYYIGRLGKIEWIERYLKIDLEKIKNIQQKLFNKSAFMAFFCFLPIIGDIIAIILGFARANILIVNIMMFAGKFLRYWLILQSLEIIKP